jgi:hypothetical protein
MKRDLAIRALDMAVTLRQPPKELKWSTKFRQRAKMYPTLTNGYENDKTMELFRYV